MIRQVFKRSVTLGLSAVALAKASAADLQIASFSRQNHDFLAPSSIVFSSIPSRLGDYISQASSTDALASPESEYLSLEKTNFNLSLNVPDIERRYEPAPTVSLISHAVSERTEAHAEPPIESLRSMLPRRAQSRRASRYFEDEHFTMQMSERTILRGMRRFQNSQYDAERPGRFNLRIEKERGGLEGREALAVFDGTLNAFKKYADDKDYVWLQRTLKVPLRVLDFIDELDRSPVDVLGINSRDYNADVRYRFGIEHRDVLDHAGDRSPENWGFYPSRLIPNIRFDDRNHWDPRIHFSGLSRAALDIADQPWKRLGVEGRLAFTSKKDFMFGGIRAQLSVGTKETNHPLSRSKVREYNVFAIVDKPF